MGHIIGSFIDDTLISHNTFEGCYKSIHATVEFLKKIAFCINDGKSVLVPTKCLEYLGTLLTQIQSQKHYLRGGNKK